MTEDLAKAVERLDYLNDQMGEWSEDDAREVMTIARMALADLTETRERAEQAEQAIATEQDRFSDFKNRMFIAYGGDGDLAQLKAERRALTAERDALAAKLQAAEGRAGTLEAGLRPFAEAAEDTEQIDEDRRHIWEAPAAMSITVGDLRCARALLTPDGEK